MGLSTYEFVMKQRAISIENSRKKIKAEENNQKQQIKQRSCYFTNLKQNFAKAFRTNNKIQIGDQEKSVVAKQVYSNGIDHTSDKEQQQNISTINLSNYCNQGDAIKA